MDMFLFKRLLVIQYSLHFQIVFSQVAYRNFINNFTESLRINQFKNNILEILSVSNYEHDLDIHF